MCDADQSLKDLCRQLADSRRGDLVALPQRQRVRVFLCPCCLAWCEEPAPDHPALPSAFRCPCGFDFRAGFVQAVGVCQVANVVAGPRGLRDRVMAETGLHLKDCFGPSPLPEVFAYWDALPASEQGNPSPETCREIRHLFFRATARALGVPERVAGSPGPWRGPGSEAPQ